ncbi:MAG: sigma factor serine-protein kinase [Ignavibacteriaceae bacterium]|nr:MAG: sigma factor serine-protein kinase [Ignavibacteriaceae bacterium]
MPDTVNNLYAGNHELRVKSSTENLALIREFVSSEARNSGISKEVVDKLILAVDEASSNIIRHAYKNSPEGEIIVTFILEGDECTIVLTDYGTGFNPAQVKSPDMVSYLKEKKRGGLGIHLMKILMDEVDYLSVSGEYNKLVLKKKIA